MHFFNKTENYEAKHRLSWEILSLFQVEIQTVVRRTETHAIINLHYAVCLLSDKHYRRKFVMSFG